MSASRLHQLWQLIEHLGLSVGKTLGDDQLLDLIQQRFCQMHALNASEASGMRAYLRLRLPLVRDIAQPPCLFL